MMLVSHLYGMRSPGLMMIYRIHSQPAARIIRGFGTSTEPPMVTDNFYIPPPPVPIAPVVTGGLAEPTFSSIGLCNYTPPGLVQAILENFHIGLQLPWWGCIMLGTVVIRTAVLPLIIYNHKQIALLGEFMPKQVAVSQRLTNARKSGDIVGVQQATADLQALTSDSTLRGRIFRTYGLMLAQGAIFTSVFFGLRGMVAAPVESLTTGGLYWFTNLTIPDPALVMPITISVTLFIILKGGGEAGMSIQNPENPNPVLKYLKWVLPPVVFSVTAFMPAALQVYWTLANFISLITSVAFRNERISKALGLGKVHPAAASSTSEAEPPPSMSVGFSDAMENARYMSELNKRAETHKWIKDELDHRVVRSKPSATNEADDTLDMWRRLSEQVESPTPIEKQDDPTKKFVIIDDGASGPDKPEQTHTMKVEHVQEDTQQTSNANDFVIVEEDKDLNSANELSVDKPRPVEAVEIVDPKPDKPNEKFLDATAFLNDAVFNQVKNVVDDTSKEEMLIGHLQNSLNDPVLSKQIEDSFKPFISNDSMRKIMLEQLRQWSRTPDGQKMLLKYLRDGFSNPAQLKNLMKQKLNF